MLPSIRNKIIEPLLDIYFVRQLEAFFAWLEKTPTAQHGIIFVNLPSLQYFCDWRRKPSNNPSRTSFIVCSHNEFDKSYAGITHNSCISDWVCLFASPVIEIWEWSPSSIQPDQKPIRYGLTETEKKILLHTARSYLNASLQGQPLPTQLLQKSSVRLHNISTVDVAIWIDGKLRGSMIVGNLPCIEAVATASLLACKDTRFKPVSALELPKATIQISLISDLRLPIQHHEWKANEIYPEKVYTATVNSIRGWYLPAVFNCLSFADLQGMITSLYRQKIGTRSTPIPHAITIGEVDDFIESPYLNSSPNTLFGTVVKNQTPLFSNKTYVNDAIQQLARIQEPDGNLPPVIDPLSGSQSQIDWIRLAHCCHALLSYGDTFNNAESKEVGTRAYRYLRDNYFLIEPRCDLYTRLLTSLYLLKAANQCNDTAMAKKLHTEIKDMSLQTPMEPIIQSEVANYRLRYSHEIETALAWAMFHTNEFNVKKSKQQAIALVSYIQLIPTLIELGQKLNRTDLLTAAHLMSEWFQNQQLPNGGFPANSKTNLSYTRGTSRVIETLFSQSSFTQNSRAQSLHWLQERQYRSENIYCIRPEFRERLLGGFRHDDCNQSVWIDSTAHILLALVNAK